VLCLLPQFFCRIDAQEPISQPACKDGNFPWVVQLTPDSSNPGNKLKLARKRFYLSSLPFELATNVDLTTIPTLRNYYKSVGASPHLIDWFERNHCDTIYCRELTADEVACDDTGTTTCVPEFTTAYRNALKELNGNQEMARKWVTNYPPLSSQELRIGFFDAKTDWFKRAVEAIETRLGITYRIKSTITDKDGVGYFYDLCPGSYYVSSIGPIGAEGSEFYWESTKPIKVEGPPAENQAIRVTLAFPPGKEKKNWIIAKPVVKVVSDATTSAP
jgi:hypothetical protein